MRPTGGTNKHYTEEFRKSVVESYLRGDLGGADSVARHYGINKSQVKFWVDRYRSGQSLALKKPTGRPKKTVGLTGNITKDEELEYLRMENAILKALREIQNNSLES